MVEKPLIELKNIIKTYRVGTQSSTVLNQISLTVHANDLLGIVGVSGSGKSTLMHIIGLLDKADRGDYWLQERNVAHLTSDALAMLRNQMIGFVFQQFHLLPRVSAAQNVALPLTYRKMSALHIKQQVSDALERVGMGAFAEHCPAQLSGGQQQRVAIARALVTDPCVILADEPTGSLDSHTGQEVMQLFLDLHQEGRTIILITHDSQIAAQCRRRIMLADGQVVS